MENNNKKKIRYFDNQSNVSQNRQVPVFDTKQLFGDSREIRLHHCSEEYRLILTKNNKLILTK
jgi:hemin uptake protein HemP